MKPPSHLQPDGTFRPDDPLYPLYNSYDWSYRDQDDFEAVWTPAGDTKTDELADKYGHGRIYLIAGRKVGGQTTPLITVRPL